MVGVKKSIKGKLASKFITYGYSRNILNLSCKDLVIKDIKKCSLGSTVYLRGISRKADTPNIFSIYFDILYICKA